MAREPIAQSVAALCETAVSRSVRLHQAAQLVVPERCGVLPGSLRPFTSTGSSGSNLYHGTTLVHAVRGRRATVAACCSIGRRPPLLDLQSDH